MISVPELYALDPANSLSTVQSEDFIVESDSGVIFIGTKSGPAAQTATGLFQATSLFGDLVGSNADVDNWLSSPHSFISTGILTITTEPVESLDPQAFARLVREWKEQTSR